MSDITGRSLPFKFKMHLRQIALPRFAALNRRRKKKSQFIQLQIKNRMLHSFELRLKAMEEGLAIERERADRAEAALSNAKLNRMVQDALVVEDAFALKAEFDRLQTELAAARAELTDAAHDVLAERRRQIEAEGWTPEHDDEHDSGELADAAACYAAYAESHRMLSRPPLLWPWPSAWWKPSPDMRRNLVKAAALLLAEIERLDRASLAREGA